MTSQTKLCHFCAEEIPSKSIVCPRCRQWLTFHTLSHPAYQLWIMIVPIIIAIFAWGWLALNKLERTVLPRPFYTEVPDSLRLLEPKLIFRPTDSGTRMYIIGLVTNQSQFAWEDTEFECRFYDTNNVMVDVAHPRSSMTVQPHDEAAFSLWIRPNRATNDYSSFRLKIMTARSAQGGL
jgi:hypothetical protein